MLVHIERQNRCCARQGVAMVGGPLVHELAIARRPGEQNPAGAAAESLSHRHEFRAPAFVRAEVAGQRLFQTCIRLALVTEPVKEQLMQDHGIHRDQLFAFEAVDEKSRGLRVVELC